MTDISKLETLLNWQLLAGSHKFPGADGGTCINEAAIVAAGFKYRKISGSSRLPRCFSRVLGLWLMGLNDNTEDWQRQRLIRYVLKLPGSRDKISIERERLMHLVDGLAALRSETYSRRAAVAKMRVSLGVCRGRAGEETVLASTSQAIAIALGRRITTHPALMDAVLRLTDEAFAIGKQAEPIGFEIARCRMEEVTGKRLRVANEQLSAPIIG